MEYIIPITIVSQQQYNCNIQSTDCNLIQKLVVELNVFYLFFIFFSCFVV